MLGLGRAEAPAALLRAWARSVRDAGKEEEEEERTFLGLR